MLSWSLAFPASSPYLAILDSGRPDLHQSVLADALQVLPPVRHLEL